MILTKQNHEKLDVLTERAEQPFIRMKFKIMYLADSHVVNEVEVRNVNYLDLRRHLQAGETVEIIPEFSEDDIRHNSHDEKHCYITHS